MKVSLFSKSWDNQSVPRRWLFSLRPCLSAASNSLCAPASLYRERFHLMSMYTDGSYRPPPSSLEATGAARDAFFLDRSASIASTNLPIRLRLRHASVVRPVCRLGSQKAENAISLNPEGFQKFLPSIFFISMCSGRLSRVRIFTATVSLPSGEEPLP